MIKDAKLYINGDSYSAYTEEHKVWPEIISEKLALTFVNQATPGSSNNRILRNSLEYISQNDKIECVIIASTFLSRDEEWVADRRILNKFVHTMPDWERSNGSKFITSNFLNNLNVKLEKQLFEYYQKVFLLTQMLKSKNIKYLIFSAAINYLNGLDWDNDSLNYRNKLHIYKLLQQDPGFKDVDEFSLVQWAINTDQERSDSNHLFAQGHLNFAEYLLEQAPHLLA
jgi:hypothetical protein